MTDSLGHIAELQKILSEFLEREENLRRVTRYSLYPVMYYRTSLSTHAKRVAWEAAVQEEMLARAFPALDFRYLLALALVHDDAEIITGDVQAAYKQKMNGAQLSDIENAEERAIEKLSDMYPKNVGEFVYRDMLVDVLRRESLETQILKYFDWEDAEGEALHELYAGNTCFAIRKFKPDYGELPTPAEFYVEKWEQFAKQFPQTAPLFELPGTIFTTPVTKRDWLAYMQGRAPHTKESIREKIDDDRYMHWRDTIINAAETSGDAEELANLTTQLEHSKKTDLVTV